MPMPWKRSKKLSQPCGADPREACAWHTDRGVVPGRDAGRPEEQAHLSLGQEGLPSPRHARSTDRIDLLVRCGLPRTRDWRRPRAAGLQQRSHAAPSRRDRNQGHLGCPRDHPARSSRLAWHENAEGPKQHVVDATAAARTRTQRPGKHLAVHATELAFQPGFQILRRHRRPLLLRLEHAYRSALENHVRRTPRLGNRRSFYVRIGIISSVMLLEMPFANRRTALPSAPIYATMPAPRRLTSSSLRYSSVARAQRAGARR